MQLYCKNCGSEIEIANGQKIAVCDFCGMEQTLPIAKDEQMLELFAKANSLRRESNFDIAKKQYESIIEQYPEENEAYWCKLLCEYGIEYVEDILTEKNLPTCHRTIRESIFDNKDYKLIMSRASAEEKAIYETEAKEIDRIQKEILLKAEKEEPYDIFICYKESDEKGMRTRDSQIATKIYTNLTNKNYKVFFSRVTLKELAGSKYEPLIYSALRSAKVMLIVTTSNAYVNAPWVRNEWSRFIEFSKQDDSKSIVPCISIMDAYDLPTELNEYQALNTTDMDFLENLTRQIDSKFGRNIATAQSANVANSGIPIDENATQTSSNGNIQPLLKRINIFLLSGDWEKADEYAERVLDIDPECGEAYLGKLLVEQKVKNKEQLKYCADPFDNSKNYQLIMMFAEDGLKQEIKGYSDCIKERNENTRKQGVYEKATSLMLSAKTESEYKEAGKTFELIKGYKDAQALATECYDKAEEVRKNATYERAKKTANENTIESYEKAITIYKSIIDWKDSKEQIEYCNKRITEIKDKNEAVKREQKRCEELIKLLTTAKSEKEVEEIKKEAQSNLSKIESEKKELDKIKEKFPALQDVSLEIKELESKIYTLRTERESLGFFAMKRKIEIDAEIKDLVRNEKEKETKKEKLKQELKGYVSISEIEKDEEKYTKQIEETKAEIEKNKTLLTKEEIIAELKKSEIGAKLYDEWKKESKIQKLIKVFKIDKKIAERGSLMVGTTVKFGKYYQSNTITKEDIEWQVLRTDGNRVLLISKCALDSKPYNTLKTDVTWGDCTLRKWLNNEFIDTAFSSGEKAMIPTVTVSADKNPDLKTEQGDDTKDKVFLLSIDEAKKYYSSNYKETQTFYPSNKERQCKPTWFSQKNGVYILTHEKYQKWLSTEYLLRNQYKEEVKSWMGNTMWWLRTVGAKYGAAIINDSGIIKSGGILVNEDNIAVRPALWVNLE